MGGSLKCSAVSSCGQWDQHGTHHPLSCAAHRTSSSRTHPRTAGGPPSRTLPTQAKHCSAPRRPPARSKTCQARALSQEANGTNEAPSRARAAKDAAAAIRSIEELFGQASPTCERACEHKSEWALACRPRRTRAKRVGRPSGPPAADRPLSSYELSSKHAEDDGVASADGRFRLAGGASCATSVAHDP